MDCLVATYCFYIYWILDSISYEFILFYLVILFFINSIKFIEFIY